MELCSFPLPPFPHLVYFHLLANVMKNAFFLLFFFFFKQIVQLEKHYLNSAEMLFLSLI